MKVPSETHRDGLMRLLSRLPLCADRPLVGYLVALALSLAGLALRFIIEGAMPPGYPFVTFFPVVPAAAFLFGLGPALFAAVLCGAMSRWFFVAPVHSFSLGHGSGMAMALYVFVVGIDMILIETMHRTFGQLKREREYSRQLAEHREILFRELQHRVGNNLQMVGALLGLQRRKVEDPAARAVLDDAAHRLTLIGRIQRELYGAADDQRGLHVFLREIVRDLVASAGREDIVQRVEGGDGLWLHPDDAIPVALIVAEVVANALEHGFAGRTGGEIEILIAPPSNELVIAIRNDGHPLPEGFEAQTSTSLGLRLARNLAAGRKGRFSVTAEQRLTVARIALPWNGSVRT